MKHFLLTLILMGFLSTSVLANIPGTAPNCYDPVNIGKIGQTGWTGCEGKLIVSRSILQDVIANNNFYAAKNTTWNVSEVFTGQVTDMSYLFMDHTGLDDGTSGLWDITDWDTSNVTNMYLLFRNTTNFAQDVSNWDVSNVWKFRYMFQGASQFNADLSKWNVESSSMMVGMFYQASSFNQDLSGWCVSNIPSKPTNFDVGAASWSSPKPVWGTCPEDSPETCSDGLQNQDETGVDCGGICGACPPETPDDVGQSSGPSVWGGSGMEPDHIYLKIEEF